MLKVTTKRDLVRFNYSDHLLVYEDMRCGISNQNLYQVPVPSIRHQAVALKIAAALLRHVEARKLGHVLQAPCNVMLSERMVIQPDILFIRRERRGLIGKTNLRGAPDLVIEILSRSTRERLRTKRKIYAHFEIPEYWDVDPEANTIETLVWSEVGYLSVGSYCKSDRLSSPLLPNFNLPLSGIFATEEE